MFLTLNMFAILLNKTCDEADLATDEKFFDSAEVMAVYSSYLITNNVLNIILTVILLVLTLMLQKSVKNFF